MLAPVARPPAPRRAAIWSFFLNVILIEYTLGSFNIQDYGIKNLYTHSGMGRTKITRSVSALIIVSVKKRAAWSMQVAWISGFQNPDMGVQTRILSIMTGR